jgi:hypothetical protein
MHGSVEDAFPPPPRICLHTIGPAGARGSAATSVTSAASIIDRTAAIDRACAATSASVAVFFHELQAGSMSSGVLVVENIEVATLRSEICSSPRAIAGAVFAIGIWSAGPTAVTDAPPASDSAPANTTAVTAFARLFGFEACLARDMVKNLPFSPVLPLRGCPLLR